MKLSFSIKGWEKYPWADIVRIAGKWSSRASS